MVLDGPNKRSGMKCGAVDSRAKAETSRKTSVIFACAHKSSPSGQRGQSDVAQRQDCSERCTHTNAGVLSPKTAADNEEPLKNAPRNCDLWAGGSLCVDVLTHTKVKHETCSQTPIHPRPLTKAGLRTDKGLAQESGKKANSQWSALTGAPYLHIVSLSTAPHR